MHQGPASKMWETARGRPIVSRADSHGFKLSFSQAMGGRAIGAGGGGARVTPVVRLRCGREVLVG